jgi:cell division transport system ATP-binding protein
MVDWIHRIFSIFEACNATTMPDMPDMSDLSDLSASTSSGSVEPGSQPNPNESGSLPIQKVIPVSPLHTSTSPALFLEAADIYQQQTLVLSQVNFSIEPGEFVYLIGKTGAGKSSLLKTLYGDIPLQVGAGQVGGLSLSSLKPADIPILRRKLGIVFQDFQLLYDRTVNENLLFVLRATGWNDLAKMKQRSAEVLKLVGLNTKDFKMPHELSGGEQQRVVVARALLNYPTLVLADEPTGNLDPDTSLEIMQLLTQIAREQGTAVLMATHDYLIIDRFPARLLRCEGVYVTDLGAILF